MYSLENFHKYWLELFKAESRKLFQNISMLSGNWATKEIPFFKLFFLKTLKITRHWISFQLQLSKIEFKCQSINNFYFKKDYQKFVKKVCHFWMAFVSINKDFFKFFSFSCRFLWKNDVFELFPCVTQLKVPFFGDFQNSFNWIIFLQHFPKFLLFSNTNSNGYKWKKVQILDYFSVFKE